MPDPDDISEEQRIDALAGVVSYGLIDAHPKTMTTDEVCAGVERGPAEREEVEVALRALVAYDLATREEEDRWKATLAAVKADELSF